MSRNCSKCGDTTCNCAIIEGPGTNVTGTGSGASPYIVEADIVHVDTPTVTLTGNGGSTPLSAVVNPCGLTDSLNEVSSGSLLVKGTAPDCLALLDPGVAGKAVISNGTGFVLGDAASPGVTNYCDSVTGDSVGYGVIDSALGVENYYDLNGTVVALRPASWEPCCCGGSEILTTLARVDDCTLRYTNEAGTTFDFHHSEMFLGNLSYSAADAAFTLIDTATAPFVGGGGNNWQSLVNYPDLVLPAPPACYEWVGDFTFKTLFSQSAFNITDPARMRLASNGFVNGTVVDISGSFLPNNCLHEVYMATNAAVDFSHTMERNATFLLNTGVNTLTINRQIFEDAPDVWSPRFSLGAISNVTGHIYLRRI